MGVRLKTTTGLICLSIVNRSILFLCKVYYTKMSKVTHLSKTSIVQFILSEEEKWDVYRKVLL